MKIESRDHTSWITIDDVGENGRPAFRVETYVDVGHGRFIASNEDVSFFRLEEFATELDSFVLNRGLAPRLAGTYDTTIQFRAEGRTIWVEFVIGDAYGGNPRAQTYALTGGFEIEEGALVSLAAGFRHHRLPRMQSAIRPATVADAAAISALVQESFTRFVAPDWEPEARTVFMRESSPERLSTSISSATFAAVAEVDDQIVGIILLPTPSRLALLFVRAAWHRRGIATQLWQAARGHIEAHHAATATVELNASLYAVAAYRALGFYPISEPLRKGGCLAIRMACWLPGLALTRAMP